ncbi:MAG: hypothetical protein ACI8TA_003292 [Cyclobacteriaceae bacterium]|jgi:hypothetical protein
MGVSDSKKLTSNPNYYYSYHRAGCADMNWVSNLFYIDNFKVYQIGEIYGNGCDTKEITISIIELFDSETGLVLESKLEALPIDTIETYDDYKWGFINDYWNKNFEKFKQ